MSCANPRCGHPERNHECKIRCAVYDCEHKHTGPCWYDKDCPCGKYRKVWKQ